MHQLFHLEALHVAAAEPVAVGIQQLAVGAAQHIGCERLAQRIRLQQYRQARHGALFQRRPGKAVQRRPDGGLLVGADRHAFVQQPTFHPFGGPGAVALLVDMGERLEGDPAIGTEVVVLTPRPRMVARIERPMSKAKMREPP